MSLNKTLPGPLMTSEPGSFARATIVERKPQILKAVLDDHAYPQDILRAAQDLHDEIAGQIVQPLTEQAPDVASWNRELEQYAGKTWLELPWYFAETFFYRKLLQALRYYQPGPWQGVDPFEPQKQRQTQADLRGFARMWEQIQAVPENERFEVLLHSALWGNRTDLSNFTLAASAAAGLAVGAEQHLILIDHTQKTRRLLEPGVQRVDFINDNIGTDLIYDLTLTDYLLSSGWAAKVVFHLKDAPFFVSDAMPKDARDTIQAMQSSDSTGVQALGRRLGAALEQGRLALESDPFWNSWRFFTELPRRLRDELEQADLVIVKGDANYRRVLEDRHWPHTTHLEDAPASLPRPYLLMRTLKSEVMVGLEPGAAEALAAEDPKWLINGRRGLIHLVEE